ncbi:MAG: tyrosine-type recombinase/integrase, partial [Pyrinomonadaceae bacterium]
LRRSKIDGANRTGTDGICTLYSFRHTFATRFLERRPGDLLTLAALLGHSSLRMVMRYAHPSDEHKFDAIKSMEEDHQPTAYTAAVSPTTSTHS